jgi:hypothetical protein
MRAEGYQTQKRSLRIDSGSAKTLSAILEPATGTILLTGAFESRPEILLDSAPPDERNVTFRSDRIEIREVTAGRHFMRLTLPGSQGWQETVDIEAGKSRAVPVTLRSAPPVTATVLVATRPLGARVAIRSGAEIVAEGASDARGEFSAVLGPGTYDARVSAEGYQSMERTLRIDSDSPKTLSAILEPAKGSVLLTGSFESEPQILLDSALISLTGVDFPAEKIEIPASVGQRSLLVVQAGFEDWRRDVDVRPGETTAVAATPQAKPSVLRVKSVPGAEVFIGDARKATVPDLGMIEITGLPPGPYDLRIVKDKYFESTLPVNLRPGRASAIEADLVRRFSGAFADSFDDLSNWLAPVSWQAEAGRLHVKGPGTGMIRDREYRDFTLDFDLRFAEGGEASWILRAESDRDYFLFRLQEPRGARRGRFIVEFYRDGRKARQTSQAVPIEFGDEWYHVKVEAKGARIEHSISSRLNPVPARVHVLDSGTFGMMYNYGTIGFGTQGAEEFAVSGFSVHPVEN